MKKRILFVIVLAMVALVVITAPASATRPTDVSGKIGFAGPPTNLVMQTSGKNCIIDVDVIYAFYDGDLNGTAPVHLRVVSHGPCPVEQFQYNENLHASGTFVGEVDGKTGTFDFKYVGKGWPAEPSELALTAKIVVLSGTGELENLHGVFDVSYIMGDEFDSFSGQIHFDP